MYAPSIGLPHVPQVMWTVEVLATTLLLQVLQINFALMPFGRSRTQKRAGRQGRVLARLYNDARKLLTI
jgi:hypothetical protein